MSHMTIFACLAQYWQKGHLSSCEPKSSRSAVSYVCWTSFVFSKPVVCTLMICDTSTMRLAKGRVLEIFPQTDDKMDC